MSCKRAEARCCESLVTTTGLLPFLTGHEEKPTPRGSATRGTSDQGELGVGRSSRESQIKRLLSYIAPRSIDKIIMPGVLVGAPTKIARCILTAVGHTSSHASDTKRVSGLKVDGHGLSFDADEVRFQRTFQGRPTDPGCSSAWVRFMRCDPTLSRRFLPCYK